MTDKETVSMRDIWGPPEVENYWYQSDDDWDDFDDGDDDWS